MDSSTVANVSFDAAALVLDAATTLAKLAQEGAVAATPCQTPNSAGRPPRIDDSCADLNKMRPQRLSTASTAPSTTSSDRGLSATLPDGCLSFNSIPKWKRSFPLQLMDILDDRKHADCITWLASGLSFAILQPDVLTRQVLPKYTPVVNIGVAAAAAATQKTPKFVSFTRKLHRWGFRPDTRCGGDLGAFTHPLFRRDQPELCLEMACDRLGIAGKKIPAMKTAATAGKPKSKHSVTPVKTQSPKPIKHKRKASGRQQTRNAVASTSRSVEPCPSKSTKPVSVCDDSDDAQSIATAITRMSTVARPLAVLAPTPAFPIAVGAGMPAILTTANAAAAIVQHNTTLTQEALARRNQADRLEVARLMLLHNYLTALSEQLPK